MSSHQAPGDARCPPEGRIRATRSICIVKTPPVRPLARLGKWDGDAFVSVEAGTLDAPRCHVLVHGWCRGLRPQVEDADEFLRVWDPEAETDEGSRYDRWFAPMAEAIVAQDPAAAVVAFTWADEAATESSVLTGVLSQRRTTINGQRLAVALREAFGDHQPAVHMIGYSHGAKVVSVASVVLQPTPKHITLLDSPENTLPVIGGALNDLETYLRALVRIHDDGTETFIDNYVSEYGVRYGLAPGLGEVVDVVLEPEALPLDDIKHDHSYAWKWYLHSARNPDRGVGLSWSPLVADRTGPAARELIQEIPDEGEEPDPLRLVPTTDSQRGTPSSELSSRIRETVEEAFRLETSGGPVKRSGWYWRNSGDVAAVIEIRWIEGSPTSRFRVVTDRIERAISVKGWVDNPDRTLAVPLAGARSGLMRVVTVLDSDGPAAIEVKPVTKVYAFVLPSGSEWRSWIRFLAVSGFTAVVAATIFGLLFGSRRRRAQSVLITEPTSPVD